MSLQKLYCSSIQSTIPPLEHLHNLKALDCSSTSSLPTIPSSLERLECTYNHLTKLPDLPPSLRFLNCHDNQLTYLPKLPLSLKIVYCNNNQLTSLPELPPSLEILFCAHNQLTLLPEIPLSLQTLTCAHNQLLQPPNLPPMPLPLTKEIINNINKPFQCIERFKMLFYCLKYKAKLRDWLWLKVRLPNIEKMYHPAHLNELLDASKNKTEEELDDVLTNW